MRNTGDVKKIDALVAEYGKRVVNMGRGRISVVRRLNPQLEAADLVNAGYVGLILAATYYDDTKGDFWPYAKQIIHKEIQKTIRQGAPILPRYRWHGRVHPFPADDIIP